ncbi:flagellin, partial [Pseudomonas aeruginosa]|nr:flagellin [Pseudomonas aeruginosa]
GGSAVNVKVDMKGNETAEQAAAKIAAAVNDANVGIGAFSDGDTISYVSKAGKDGSGAITSAVSGVVIADTGSTGVGTAAGVTPSATAFAKTNDTVAKIDISTAKGAQSAVLVIDEA